MRRVAVGMIVLSGFVVAACGGDNDAGSSVSEGSSIPTVAGSVEPESTDASSAPSTTTQATTTSAIAPNSMPTVTPSFDELAEYEWEELTPAAPWTARAGLRVVELDGRLFLLGGRTPNQSATPGDSRIWADVWASDDAGITWTQLLEGDEPDLWPARAYFQAIVKDDSIYVIGGQDFGLEKNPFCALLEQGLEPPPGLGIDPDAPCPEFLPTSEFFNDVWRSTDGIEWDEVTADAPWEGRAGLSAAVLGDHIYVFGGSKNDDSSIVGAGGPQRIYFNDVWRSVDGLEWEQVSEAAPWEPRAGAAVVVQGDRMLLLGGEDGFTCDPLPDCEPPYFNDVWSTVDGVVWNQVTESAAWSPRPGHACEPVDVQIVCFGGFGLVVNPTDMWASVDGREWRELPSAPWNVTDPTAVKYDFDALTLGAGSQEVRILTVGGDRETFDFADPENYLRVDNDVWIFAPPT